LENLPIPIGNLGIVREKAVDETMTSPDSVELAINLNFDRIGAVELRKGCTLLGTRLSSSSIQGMALYRNNAGTIYKPLAKSGGSVYAYDGSWSEVRTSLSASSKARFTNFIDLTYMVDGNSGSNCSTFDGSTFGSLNVASLPKGDFIENYRSRIWVADSSTDKVYYSDFVSTSQTITGGSSFIQVSPQDGEKITGLKRHPRALLVFKQNHIYKIYSTTSADPDPSIFRGTYSNESIVETKDGIYYHHPTGFYKFVFDGEQQEISRPIIDIVDAISRSNYENVNGWSDSDHIMWSVGDIILNGVTYSNVVCRYTISTQVWTVYSYPTEFKNSILYDNGTLLRMILGDENGYVYLYDNGVTDNGVPIFYDLQTHPLYLSTIKSDEKELSEISCIHENAEGGRILYKSDNENWSKGNVITKSLSQVFTIGAKFRKIRVRFSGNSVGSQIIFRGFEFLKLKIGGINKK